MMTEERERPTTSMAIQPKSIRTKLRVSRIFGMVYSFMLCGLLLLFAAITIILASGPFRITFIIIDLYADVVLIISLLITFLVLRRIGHMLNAASNEDVRALKELGSMKWAVISLVFCGVIPGLMLLAVQRRITKLRPNVSQTAPSEDDMERLTKLRSMLDSGLITEDDFEKQKKLILGEQR